MINRNVKIVSFGGFLFSIPIAITAYVNSSFLEKYISEYYVGLVYVFSSIVTILVLLELPRILNWLGNKYLLLSSLLANLASLLIFSFSDNIYLVIPAFILFFTSTNLVWATFDIFLEDFSKNAVVGKLRGFYLTTSNIAWVLAQIISGFIILEDSFRNIYALGIIFIIAVFLLFTFSMKNFKDPKYEKTPVLQTIKIFWQRKKILKIYLINLILKFFFAWMVIYTPIYLHEHIGFGWEKIGIIFSIMLLPFVILEFPLGKLADKIGEKKILLCGFTISAIATLIMPFITNHKWYIWALILFTTRIGAATIEVMSESYFFRSVNERDANIISFFRNTYPLSYIIAPLVATPILILVPSFEYLFVVLGAVMLLGFLIALRIKDEK